MQFDKKFLAPKTHLADLCPRERVDFRLILEDKDSHVSYGQLQSDTLVILQHRNTIPTDVCVLP